MAAEIQDIEQVRARLEENVAKSQRLLQHWQTWEAEYEGFREALFDLKDAPQPELEAVAAESGGELLTDKEIEGLLKDKGSLRSREQVLGLLSRRLDYVQTNVKTTEKRLEAEQDELDKANFADHRDEGGFPLTEITEELDDEDHVISSSTSKPGEAAPKILDALRQSGVVDGSRAPSESQNNTNNTLRSLDSNKQEQVEDASAPSMLDSKALKRKRVSFAESPEVVEVPGDPTPASSPQLERNEVVKPVEKNPDKPALSRPTIPENESPEDAALRREMLQYNMEEVGNIVAEMNLDDDSDNYELDKEHDMEYNDDDDDDNVSDFDYSDEDDEEEDKEDKFGRTTKRVVSDKYRNKMLELERKLNARSMVNVGPEFADVQPLKNGTQKEQPDISISPDDKPKLSTQKGVRFADTLDIQEPPTPKPVKEAVVEPPANQNHDRPVAVDIVERPAISTGVSTDAPAPRKVSKFKASRAGQQTPKSGTNLNAGANRVVNGPLAGPELADRLIPATQMASNKFSSLLSEQNSFSVVPEGPPGKTHAENLVERPMQESQSPAAEPDELDPMLLNQQIVDEYNRMRNNMIQRQDGFMSIDEEDLEDDQGRPKMSRFKAARLARS